MSDGFFRYPECSLFLERSNRIRELKDIQPIGEHHPWIEKQIEVVKEIRSHFHEEIASFLQYLLAHFLFGNAGSVRINPVETKWLQNFIKEDPETLAHVLDVIAGDISTLSRRLIQEAGVEGFTSQPSRSKMSVWQMKNTASSLSLVALLS